MCKSNSAHPHCGQQYLCSSFAVNHCCFLSRALKSHHFLHTTPISSRSNYRISASFPTLRPQLKKKTLEVTVWDYDRSSSNDFLGEVSISRLWALCLEMSKTLSIDLKQKLATAAALLIYCDILATEQALFILTDWHVYACICLQPMIWGVSFGSCL